MLGGDCRKFLNDELGGGTVMGLLWLILLVGIIGLAVDTINGFRNRTMLQPTFPIWRSFRDPASGIRNKWPPDSGE